MGVESSRARRDHIDKHSRSADLQHPPRLTQPADKILPVMRRKTAGEQIETRIFKGQVFRRCRFGVDVGQTALRGGGGNHLQHGGRKIAGRHLPGIRRQRIGDMAAPVPRSSAWAGAWRRAISPMAARSSPLAWTALET
jgi:hypothetical protein